MAKFASRSQRKTKNPNCNHNNNSVFYQPNYRHVQKGQPERMPRSKHEALEMVLAFIDAPVLDIRDKKKSLPNKQGEGEPQPMRLSSSSPAMPEGETPNYLEIIEIYFPELKELGKLHKKLLQTLLSNDLPKDQFIELLRDLLLHLNFKEKKCVYCSETAMQSFKVMEFVKVQNFMKITDLDPITFVYKTILDHIQTPVVVQQVKKIQQSLSPLKQVPPVLKKKPEEKKRQPIIKTVKEDTLPPWKNPEFKDKEKAMEMKEKAFYEFINKYRKINKLLPIKYIPPKDRDQPPQRGTYKYFIGKGNNSYLLKFSFKQYRWWWQQGKPLRDDWTSLHFIWTQWRNVKILGQLKQGGEQKKEVEVKRKSLPNDYMRSNSSTRAAPMKGVNIGVVDKAKSQIQYNHLENNFQISNKKALYYNMRSYYIAIGEDIFNSMPVTYHVKDGILDKEFKKFEEDYNQIFSDTNNIWIVKPGENTNRGCGITVCKDLAGVKEMVNTVVYLKNDQKRSYIIQKYIEKPFLFKQRKFDIRCYGLVTVINGNYCGYWYEEGYLRTCSKEFSLKNCANKYIHLTNDAIQMRGEDYGKFENGNKLSFSDFQKYLDTTHSELKCDFRKQIVPQLKKLTTDTMKAVWKKIDPKKRQNTFELFGYDYMIDEDLKVYLIEVNTNPCLDISSPLLSRLIPQLLENVVKIAIDPVFPPFDVPIQKRGHLPDITENKFELVFNEDTDACQLQHLQFDDNDIVAEEDMEEDAAESEEEDFGSDSDKE